MLFLKSAPFFHERNLENPRRAYLVLTADKGMAGAYNQNLLKFLREHADPNDRFYVIGQVGYRALRHRDPRLVEEFRYSATAPTLQRARDITVDAIDDFKSGKLDEIYIVYTKIQNALTSEPVMERLLPLDRRFLQPAPKGLGDPRGEVELVPDAWTVFEQIAPIYMHGMIFGAMTESFCAEQSARMTAMDSATKSANDMIRDLQLEYNRTRQGSITQEITEYNISIGKGSYVNFNCVFLDLGPIRLGQRCLIGPGVQLLTAVHPMNAAERATGKEKGAGIEIGDDCWLGGGVIVCPGVKIGCRCVIGAGSVVTHDIPDDSVAAGNPARVIRTATDE